MKLRCWALIKPIIGNLHLHPLCQVIKAVQFKEGVLQSGDGAVCIQQATHVEFVAVASVPRARSPAQQGQRLSLEVTGQHGGGGAGTRVRLICQWYRENIYIPEYIRYSQLFKAHVYRIRRLSALAPPSFFYKQTLALAHGSFKLLHNKFTLATKTCHHVRWVGFEVF